jgi:hypothetical protein
MLARIVRHRGRMNEEIEVDRLARRGGGKLRRLRPQLLWTEQRRGQRTEPTRLSDRNGKFGVHGAGHRRAHDRVLDAEQIEQAAIRPHGPFPPLNARTTLPRLNSHENSQIANVDLRFALSGAGTSRHTALPSTRVSPRP